ncbi:MAPK/MAK/MRK overlapping kinase [Blattella germanica]|nr:MAPK/MAK/MRK overlapping kinase [Blattella germanica]
MDMSMYDLLKSRKRCLPESRVKNYLYQILKGVDHLHQHGLFHRDIKPENILLKVQSELVKLADLGSVKGIYCRPPHTEYISTRWYRSPECLLTTGYYGSKMDIWATGCVFYELLTYLTDHRHHIHQLNVQNVYNSPQPGTSREIPEPGTLRQIPEPITSRQSPQPSTSRRSPQHSTSTQLPSTNSLEPLNETGTYVSAVYKRRNRKSEQGN